MFGSRVVLVLAFLGVFAVCGAASAHVDAFIDPAGGGVWLVADHPTDIFGYELIGPNGSFTYGAAWESLTKVPTAGWFEVPDNINQAILSEGTFGSLALTDGQEIDLGTPYVGASGVTAGDFTFSWGNPDTGLNVPGSVTVVPEPATWLLLCCAGLGMLLFRRRR